MARKKTEINEKTLEVLKNEILKKARFELKRSVDCDRLAEVVSKETRTYINGISFKRIYGFTKYPFNPSIQTLNILSQYIGFKNWNEVEFYYSTVQPISKNELDIYLSFYDIDPIDKVSPTEGGMQSISRKIARRFRQDSKTFIRNIPQFVEKEYFRVFYAEQLIDYDNLCLFSHLVYDEYLKYAEDDETFLFGYTVKYLYALWMMDEKKMQFYHDKIINIEINSDYHPYIIGRYFTTMMTFDHIFNGGKKFKSIFEQYLKIRKKLSRTSKHFKYFPGSEYIVSEALLHCKKYKECISLIQNLNNEYKIVKEFVFKGYYRQIHMFWLIAKKLDNPAFEFQGAFEKIKPENFNFISEKYFTCLYHYGKFLYYQNEDEIEKAENLANKMNNQYLIKNFLRLHT